MPGKLILSLPEDLQKSSTTRACIFATLHVEATELLMDLMENTGLRTYIGKVNMDRNGTAELQEESAAVSTKDTIRWINDTAEKYENVKPFSHHVSRLPAQMRLCMHWQSFRKLMVFRYSPIFPRTRVKLPGCTNCAQILLFMERHMISLGFLAVSTVRRSWHTAFTVQMPRSLS